MLVAVCASGAVGERATASLLKAGIRVVRLPLIDAADADLLRSDVLVGDEEALSALVGVGPKRRLLVVSPGHPLDPDRVRSIAGGIAVLGPDTDMFVLTVQATLESM